MTDKKTTQDNKLREEQVRDIENKTKARLMSKISLAVSECRYLAYHDKLMVLREIRDVLNEPSN